MPNRREVGDSGFPFGFFSSSQTPGEPPKIVTHQAITSRVRGGPQQGKIDPSRVQHAEHQDTGTGGSDGADSPLGNSWLKAMQEQRRSSSSSSSSSGSETDEGEGADSPLGNSWLKSMQQQRRGSSGSSSSETGGGADSPLGNSWLKAMQEQRRGGSGSSGGGTDA